MVSLLHFLKLGLIAINRPDERLEVMVKVFATW
jgi:hypothetical protein